MPGKTHTVSLRRLLGDEAGASFPEYTVLITILLAVTITVIAIMGDWIADEWQLIERTLEGN